MQRNTLTQRIADVVLRRDNRTWRWAVQTLSLRRIAWHRNRLAIFSRKLEKEFLRVGDTLENLSDASSRLLESSHNLQTFSLGQEYNHAFRSAVGAMDLPLNFHDECQEMTGRLMRNLETVAGRIARLHHFKATLDMSIAPLRILQTMFRIESASSSQEIQALFASLSAEIESLLLRMSTLIGREFEAIESTGFIVADVIGRLAGFQRRPGSGHDRRSEIQESLRVLEVWLQTDQERDDRLVDASSSISAKLAGIVGALQYQDILNQRMANISRGLLEVDRYFRYGHSEQSHDGLVYLRDVSRVEAAHLEDVQRIFTGGVQTLRSALEGLTAETADLGTHFILPDETGASDTAPDAVVRVLLDTIRENLQLTESAHVQSGEIFSLLEPVGGLLGNLTGSILGLSARIRLIALNAQIQAAKAGDGTGLEVLSSRTRTIAEDMATIVTEIAGELDALKDGVKTGLDDIAATRNKSVELIEFLREDGQRHEALLREYETRTLCEKQRAADLIAHVRRECRNALALIDTGSTADVIDCARADLTDFAQRLTVKTGRRSTTVRLAHRSHYTAAAERSTHERALREDSHDGAFESAGAPAGALAAATPEGSVEFF